MAVIKEYEATAVFYRNRWIYELVMEKPPSCTQLLSNFLYLKAVLQLYHQSD